MVILSRVDADAAQEFFGYLERGHSDPAHPIHVLRRWLTNDAAGQRRSDPHQIAARVFKAWNAWRLGKSPQYLRWTAAEPFPRPV